MTDELQVRRAQRGPGERSAVIYTIIESAKLSGHKPTASLKDVLELLPGMKAGEFDALLPTNWQPAAQIGAGA